MIIVDTELEGRERHGRPIRVAIVGAGYSGRTIALQLLTPITGMRLVAVASRSLGSAQRAYRAGGVAAPRIVTTPEALDGAIVRGEPAVTDDATVACRAAGVDAILECTGTIEGAAQVAMEAIEHGKHVILVNAELDATLGPILKTYADRRGVVLTGIDGDEPGVAMNLYRMVKTLGYRPVAAGNLKGMIDVYRTPATQQAFADKYGQNPRVVTAAADGTKLSMEATILANATGFRVARRGMYGHRCAHVRDTLKLYAVDELLAGGIVDYILGAEPHTGAFVLGYTDHPAKREYMSYFKMGDGPLYAFYTPYHLPHLQVVSTVARAVLFHDPTVAPMGEPVCDVVTVAKRDLRAGEVLDGIGGFATYGVIDNAPAVLRDNLLPVGLSQDCRVVRDISRDQPIGFDDVEVPPNRLCDRLRAEQDTLSAASAHA